MAKTQAQSANIETVNEVVTPATEVATPNLPKSLAELQAEFQNSVVELSKLNVAEDAAGYANAVKTMMAKQLAVDTEVKRLQKAELELKLRLERESKLQIINDLLRLNTENEAIHAEGSTATMDEKNAKNAEFKSVYDKLANIVLGGKVATPKPKVEGETSTGGGRSSNMDSELHPRIAEMSANGQTWAQIRETFEAEGHARSSVWHSVNRYKIANGLS